MNITLRKKYLTIRQIVVCACAYNNKALHYIFWSHEEPGTIVNLHTTTNQNDIATASRFARLSENFKREKKISSKSTQRDNVKQYTEAIHRAYLIIKVQVEVLVIGASICDRGPTKRIPIWLLIIGNYW